VAASRAVAAAVPTAIADDARHNEEDRPERRSSSFYKSDSGTVELGGIEPPSNAESPRLLRAQSVQTFYSAPTFVTDT